MSEFLKPWQRKVGIAVLLLFIQLTFTWLISLNRPRSKWWNRFQITSVSTAGTLRIQVETWEIGVMKGKWWEHLNDRDPRGIQNPNNPMSGQDVQWRLTFAGFHLGCGYLWGGRGSTASAYSCVIPFWPTAISLIGLSALLILWPTTSKRISRTSQWVAAESVT